MDAAFIFYILHVIVVSIGAGLMVWWIYASQKAGQKPSVFYFCLLLMFIGGLVSSGESAVCRYFKLVGDTVAYTHMLDTVWWHMRIFINLVADGIATFILLHRYFHIKDKYEQKD